MVDKSQLDTFFELLVGDVLGILIGDPSKVQWTRTSNLAYVFESDQLDIEIDLSKAIQTVIRHKSGD